MRKLWILTLLLLWPAYAEATKKTTEKDWVKDVFGCTESPCIIYGSKGGIIGRFEKAADQALKRHLQVRIDGECSSSCAMFASNLGDNVCLTEKAKMGIHMGFRKQVFDREGNEVKAN